MIRKTVLEHIKKYPKSEITDIVKLVFQNEFGGGHLISNKEFSLERIENELKTTKSNENIPMIEDIGNGIIRLNFAAVNEKISAESINKGFILSAEEIKGSIESFEEKISKILALCDEKLMPFDADSLSSYMENYRKSGYKPVSHSENYKKEYAPAYRIMKKEYAEMLEAITLIDNKVQNGKVVVAIDGRCASGKSTLADKMSKIYGCDVIRMDDFFLPFEKRTTERLAEPGGNVDYERFQNEVLSQICSEKEFSYGIFNCSTGKIESERTIKPSKITIIEGSYSLHPKFSDHYNVRIFVSTDSDTQIKRIRERNGEEMLKMFQDKWIPMEEKYFSHFNIENSADIKIHT